MLPSRLPRPRKVRITFTSPLALPPLAFILGFITRLLFCLFAADPLTRMKLLIDYVFVDEHNRHKRLKGRANPNTTPLLAPSSSADESVQL